jgi:NADP-reducing hydrogenase subunit HndB
MPRLTIEDLKKIKDKAKQTMTLRSGEARARITIHMGTCGISAGAREVMSAVLKEMEARGTTDVIVTTSGCAGLCSREPMATVEVLDQAPVKYVDLDPGIILKVFKEHVIGGNVVLDHALGSGSESTG